MAERVNNVHPELAAERRPVIGVGSEHGQTGWTAPLSGLAEHRAQKNCHMHGEVGIEAMDVARTEHGKVIWWSKWTNKHKKVNTIGTDTQPVIIWVRTWPAISDIWLGVRTVPVLSVAKESRGASQIAHWPRSARTQAGRCGLTDRRSSVKKLLSFVRLLMSPSLLEEITGQGMPAECSKLTCFAKVKIRHGSRAVRSTIEVGRCHCLHW